MKSINHKSFLFFLSLFVLTIQQSLFAQDTIAKTNGDKIQAKIIEINVSEIKYKKFSFLDGPTYIENKSSVQYIRFANGTKETFADIIENPKPADVSANADYYDPKAEREQRPVKIQPIGSAKYRYDNRKIGEKEMQNVLMKTNDKEIVALVQSAKDAQKLQYIGFAAIPLGIAAIVVPNASLQNGVPSNGSVITSLILFGGGVACPIISGMFKHKRTMANKKAVALYNQKF